jgi:hypothetical protein
MPEKEEFVCVKCLYYDKTYCRRNPPEIIKEITDGGYYMQAFHVEPDGFCGSGKWYFYSKQWNEWVPYFYGEWRRV